MNFFNLPKPPEDFVSEKQKFNKFVQANPSLPQVMKNWNFYNAFKKIFNFNYSATEDIKFLKLISDIINDKSGLEIDRLIEQFILIYIPQFGDIEFKRDATITKFKNQVITLRNQHEIHSTSETMRWRLAEN